MPLAFPYSDFGVNPVGYCIVTARKTLESNPDLVKRFVAGDRQGLQGGRGEPGGCRRRDGRHRRRHDERGPEGKAQALGGA